MTFAQFTRVLERVRTTRWRRTAKCVRGGIPLALSSKVRGEWRRTGSEPEPAQRVDYTAVVGEREPVGLEWGTRHITAQPFEPVAIVSSDADFGV
jgi:hypothetical protein